MDNRVFNVAVVGLSGTEKEPVGVGKSCLCNRFKATDYNTEHLSTFSHADFSSRIINTDHFLYWGEVSKVNTMNRSSVTFSIIEHTEFIADETFSPFGYVRKYAQRCATTKLKSYGKLMYVSKDQLGLENEFEIKLLPKGAISIDGFLCVFDVSKAERPVEKQLEFVANILNVLIKTKKPVVLVTTKNDIAYGPFVEAAETLVNKIEYKGFIPIVETSAHDNINVDLAFILLSEMILYKEGNIQQMRFLKEKNESALWAVLNRRKPIGNVKSLLLYWLVNLWKGVTLCSVQKREAIDYEAIYPTQRKGKFFKRQ